MAKQDKGNKDESNGEGFEQGSEKNSTGSIPNAPGTAVSTRVNQPASAVAEQLRKLGFSETKNVALPTLVLKKPSDAVTVLIREPMHVSSFTKPGEKPATVASVANILTGEQALFLVPAVVADSLRRSYPKMRDGVELTPPDDFVADRNAKDEVIKSKREKEIEWLDAQEGEWGYIGKTFYIQNNGQREGKRYKDFTVTEMQAPPKKDGE